jgi:hypothetical protein
LRPVIAVPVMAALAAIVIFQNFVTIPRLKQPGEADSTAQVYGSSYHLHGATRGENSSQITIGAKESLVLDFDFTPALAYQSYIGSLVDADGKTILTFPVSSELANKEVHLVIPAGRIQAGKQELVFSGDSNSSNGNVKAPEVQRIPFVVEFRP